MTLDEVSACLEGVRDVLLERVVDANPPRWCEARGWSEFLLALTDAELARIEQRGAPELAAHNGAPDSLRALAANVGRLLGGVAHRDAPLPPCRETRSVNARKRIQLAAIEALCREAFRDPAVRRVIDVGAGHGHLTRQLAAGLGLVGVGVDRNRARVERARALTAMSDVRFECADGTRDLPLGPSDLALGLHACGALGDALIEQAAAGGSHLLLLSCCPQKIPGSIREPVSRRGRDLRLTFPRHVLGLANAVEASDAGGAGQNGRRVRYALRQLLLARGIPLQPGEEARGLNRRRFRRGLATVAQTACALRGLAAPTAAEVAHHEQASVAEHARIRRFSAPRNMLGRLVETALVLDRAERLREHGYAVRVCTPFSRECSPRNLAIVGVPEGNGPASIRLGLYRPGCR